MNPIAAIHPDHSREPDIEVAIQKAFSFLKDEFNFDYAHFSYSSASVRIHLEVGQKSVKLQVRKIDEAHSTRLDFDMFLLYFEGVIPHWDATNHTLEQNLDHAAVLLRPYAGRIDQEIDELWLPVHKRQYDYYREAYASQGLLETFEVIFKNETEYLRNKGAL